MALIDGQRRATVDVCAVRMPADVNGGEKAGGEGRQRGEADSAVKGAGMKTCNSG